MICNLSKFIVRNTRGVLTLLKWSIYYNSQNISGLRRWAYFVEKDQIPRRHKAICCVIVFVFEGAMWKTSGKIVSSAGDSTGNVHIMIRNVRELSGHSRHE